jgi:hypothetical protein
MACGGSRGGGVGVALVLTFGLGCGANESNEAGVGGGVSSAGAVGLSGGGAGVGAAGSSGADGREPSSYSTTPSPPLELPLRTSPDPARPFQHAAEVSIAARSGHVVIAAINIHTDGEDTLEDESLLRGVGVSVSHDFGASFEPTLDPGFPADVAQTSDPVVRVGTDGAFWLGTIGISPVPSSDFLRPFALLLQSTTDGRSFTALPRAFDQLVDKEWLAPATEGAVVMGGNGGFFWLDAGGAVTASWLRDPDWPVMGAFVDARGAHFAIGEAVALWTGQQRLTFEGRLQSPEGWQTGWSVPLGPSADNGTWAVYERQNLSESAAVVELRLFSPADETGEVLALSEPGVPAFLPAAALDGEGRLHVLWYESGGERGVLKYARSLGRDLHAGFSPALVIDGDACPGNGWIPQYGEASPDRRLREYIDIAIDGQRVHAAWTHAPKLPSRVMTSHWDL